MTRLISNANLWRDHRDAGRHEAVCDWLEANGLDCLAVMSTHDVIIEAAKDGGQQIRCTVIEKDSTEPELRIVPLAVEPPADWPVHTPWDTDPVSP